MRRAAACVLACMSIIVLCFTSPAGAATTDSWGSAQEIPGLPTAVATASGGIWPVGISCPSPANCTAVAQPQSGTPGTDNVYVASQDDGTWGNWQAIPGTSALGDFILSASVSCPSVGNCSVLGWYENDTDASGTFTADESNGTWGNAVAVAGMASASALSCWSAGNCVATGAAEPAFNQTGTVYPVIATETDGAWGSAKQISGAVSSTTVGTAVGNLVSCDSAGNCAAAWDFGANITVVASEKGGTWSSAAPIPGVTALPSYNASIGEQATSISCAPAGGCTIVRTYGSERLNSFSATDSGGTWGNAVAIGGTASIPTDSNEAGLPVEVSCPSAGDCSAAGPTWLASEKSGTWGTAKAISGLTAIDPSLAFVSVSSISCAAPGDCSLAGDANGTAFVADEAGGTWAAAQVLSVPSGYDSGAGIVVSCANAANCTTVDDASVPATAQEPAQYLLYSATREPAPAAAPTTLSVSAPKLTYGSEQGEKITATANGNIYPAPGTITVTVPGGGTLCTITLVDGTGQCALAAKSLPAGASTLTGTYSGDASYAGTSGTAVITVAPAATVTRLAFTPRTITFTGAATALALTGSVTSTAGTPNGWATVRLDGKAVPGCINLAFTGTLSCKGTTATLAAGKHLVTLTYPGRGDFAASNSVSLPLTVAKRGTTTTLKPSKTTITYGQENAEKLTVFVSHAGSIYPTGKAAIKIGSTTICTISLSKGTGSCTLSKTRLKAGSYTLVASYGGNTDYSSSTARQALTVRK